MILGRSPARRARARVALGLLASIVAVGVVQAQEPLTARITYYLPTGSRMANGEWPYYGAAACSSNLSLGVRVRLSDGAEFTCADRGQLGSAGWLDLYAPTPEVGREFVRRYGNYARVEIIP